MTTEPEPKTTTRSSFMDRLGAAVQRILNNPIALIAFGISAILAMTQTANPLVTLVKAFATKLSAIEVTKFLGDFLAAHVTQTIGAIALCTSVIVSARRNEKTTYFIGAIAFAYLVPEWSVWTYGALSAALALFFQLRQLEDRLILATVSLAVYLMAMGSSASEATPTTQPG